ncbi:hypothetical protein FHW88_000428 [Mucilaginibacter sp. SG538B]|uniref:hypothetical protein n=1 Tax=Mucilaginibacter sp. SG538B TaxID=2587021 RepID=UPI0017C5B580|nr:hypothetical protein [Mucilaginibacter sp. SG538B]NVM62152.1 hypothetical protein [Mucilaginibacter sp. SG538B]
MKKYQYGLLGLGLLMCSPFISQAQDITSSLKGMQPVLNKVYDQRSRYAAT